MNNKNLFFTFIALILTGALNASAPVTETSAQKKTPEEPVMRLLETKEYAECQKVCWKISDVTRPSLTNIGTLIPNHVVLTQSVDAHTLARGHCWQTCFMTIFKQYLKEQERKSKGLFSN